MKLSEIKKNERFMFRGYWFQNIRDGESWSPDYHKTIELDYETEVEPFDRSNKQQQEEIFASREKGFDESFFLKTEDELSFGF